LVMPSLWYETFGRVILEAYAIGTPVIASNLGVMSEFVEDRKTGLLFAPGDAQDLAAKAEFALAHPGELAAWGQNARQVFESKLSADIAYERLIEIYTKAIEDHDLSSIH
ncbi:MAG: glycosyltransferase family 4 protein, partial [Gammaproteobacteria bacterium]|nr:glycosyltransferase family 4 protein [Gammaproteobacteria bacterium]